MQLIIRIFVATHSLVLIQSLPINNGFSVKFNPLNTKDEVKQKSVGALFAKISQTLSPEADERRQIISKVYYPNPPELGVGCTNQVAKIVYPVKNASDVDNYNKVMESLNFINLPILKQPIDNYKIIVATAPSNMKLSSVEDNKPVIVYIVFPEDGSEEESPYNIPLVYFVSQQNLKMDISKKEKTEPILIIDSNRKVTGLKSKEIEKFVKFKNKLINRYNYEVLR